MPSTYAHFRAGQAVRQRLEPAQQQDIRAWPELYQIGLHGPDILFYYHPYTKNRVSRVGYSMHEKSGAAFFSYAAHVLKEHKEQTACRAYVYGVLCHFALDVSCHGLIAEKMAQSGLSHAEVEVELDRALLELDGLDPVRQHLTDHIVPSHQNALLIKEFYPGVSVQEIEAALRGFVFYNNLLRAPSPLKRNALFLALRAAGCYREIHGMVLRYQADQRCIDSTEQLLQLYQRGETLAVRLIGEYQTYLSGEAPLDEIYRYNFESQLLEQ